MVFDLDGTLIHHEHDWFYPVLCEAFKALGTEPPTRTHFDELVSEHRLFADIPAPERNQFEHDFWSYIETHEFPTPRLIEGVHEVLDRLLVRDTVVAIATARSHLPEDVEYALKDTGLLKHVSVISTLGEPHLLTRNGAPDLKKRQLLGICERLRVDPCDTYTAGDSPHDITSGHAAGLKCSIGLLSGGIKRELIAAAKPHLIVRGVPDLIGVFE